MKIFVTGATGNQGGAVVSSLVKNGIQVKALVRKTDTAKAQSLQNKMLNWSRVTWMI